MNLNKKIAKFSGDGIPAYNGKINELIDAVNWLAGVRTINGKVIAESDQGPIIDLSQVSSTQTRPDPSATDPDGNQAGWMKVLVLNPNFDTAPPGKMYWEQWIWTSNTLATASMPWLVDPNGAIANWLMGANGGVWGTGQYPTGVVGNFIKGYSKFTGAMAIDGNGPSYQSPYNFTINPSGGNIPNPPTNPPAFYITSQGNANGPVISVGGGATNLLPTDTVTWALNVIYDGTTVLSYSGTTSVSVNPGWTDVTLDKTGWVFDPSGLPGYAHGAGLWVWEYHGSISSNHDPIINQNFVFSSISGSGWIVGFENSNPGYVYLTS